MRETTLLLVLSLALVIVGGLYLLLERGDAAHKIATLQALNLDGFSIYMHRLGCVPDCPSYAVLAKGSGELEFEGVANVAHVGSASASISDAQLQLLFIEVYRSGLLQLDADHVQGTPGCQTPEPNRGRITYGVTLDDKTTVLTYYRGCEQRLESLEELGRRIDEILNTDHWIKVADGETDG